MKMYHKVLNNLLVVLTLSIFSSGAEAYTKPWSDWYQVKDEALNGVWFSWKCDAGYCEYRMDNRYTTPVKISYSLRHTDSSGSQKVFRREQRLATGVNESTEFTLPARELKGVEVAIIEPKYTGPKSTQYVPTSTEEVDTEKKMQQAIQEAEERESAQARQAEARKAAQVRQAKEEGRERIREAREERAAEQQRRIDEKNQQVWNDGLKGLSRTFNNGMQQLADTDRYIANAQAEQRRQQEEQRRETQRVQRQEASDRKERERIATAQRADQERERRAEAARREEERKEGVRKEEERKEREVQERKRIEAETCHDRTYLVKAISKRPKNPKSECDGYLGVHLTNNASEKVECRVKYYLNGAPTGDAGMTTLRPGETQGGDWAGLWSCPADNFKYKCALPNERSKCTEF